MCTCRKLNVVLCCCLQLLGGLICAAGLWAWSEKDMFNNIGQVTQIPLDPALFLIIGGAVVFVIGFTGCVGALRENTVLLLIVSVAFSQLSSTLLRPFKLLIMT